MKHKMTVTPNERDRLGFRGLWRYPVLIAQELAHIYRKEIKPGYEPGGSNSSWMEVRTLAGEWSSASWWCTKRVFVTWFFYLGIIVSALLAVTAANNLGWIDISGGSEFQTSLDPAGFYSAPSEKAIDALLSEPLALEGGE